MLFYSNIEQIDSNEMLDYFRIFSKVLLQQNISLRPFANLYQFLLCLLNGKKGQSSPVAFNRVPDKKAGKPTAQHKLHHVPHLQGPIKCCVCSVLAASG